MPVTLYRDKEGRVVYQFPFILIVDPIMNQGAIYQDEVAVDEAFLDDDLLDDATPETILPRLAARGYRIYYLRSEADLEDELLPYLAISDGQLQDAIASLWVQQDMAFEGSDHVDWEHTTTRLYTDGERLFCEGHEVVLTLPETEPGYAPLAERVRGFLEAFAQAVAAELRTQLVHVKGAASKGK
ncbi:MAG TPA: hypothetical protein V6D47_18005 [Oscillatoriaceae cyanobacterium]